METGGRRTARGAPVRRHWRVDRRRCAGGTGEPYHRPLAGRLARGKCGISQRQRQRHPRLVRSWNPRPRRCYPDARRARRPHHVGGPGAVSLARRLCNLAVRLSRPRREPRNKDHLWSSGKPRCHRRRRFYAASAAGGTPRRDRHLDGGSRGAVGGPAAAGRGLGAGILLSHNSASHG